MGASRYATSEAMPVRLAETRGVSGRGDRARELRQLELVREDRRHGPPRRLPRVHGGEREVDDQERQGRLEAGEEVWPASHGARDDAGVRSRSRWLDGFRRGELDVAADDDPAWDPRRRPRPRSRRRVAPAPRPGSSPAPRPHASTRSRRAASSSPPTTLTPRIRRRRTRGLSSRNPTTRASPASRSSRARLRPARPAPAMSTRLPDAPVRRSSPGRGAGRASSRRRGRCRARRRPRRSGMPGTSRSAAAR